MNYEEKLIELGLKNENLLVLTAENRASIRNLPNVVKNQFIDTGINEQSLIGLSAGLALRGRIPVVHAIAAFITMRAFEFIRTDVGFPKLNVNVVGNFAGFLSTGNGPTHQAIEDVALMRGIPHMNVFCPADIDDLIKGLDTVINYKRPFYIRYNDLPAKVEHSEFALGKAEVFGDGTDVAIIVYGTLFGEAFRAKKKLEAEGISTRLINLRTVKPIDEMEIIKSVKECGTIVTLEDHFKIGGLRSIVSELMVQEKIMIDLLPISLDKKFFKPAQLHEVLEYEGFNATTIKDKIKNHISEKEKKFNVECSNA